MKTRSKTATSGKIATSKRSLKKKRMHKKCLLKRRRSPPQQQSEEKSESYCNKVLLYEYY